MFPFSTCNLAGEEFLCHLKNPRNKNIVKRNILTERKLCMFFSLPLRPYKFNSYQIISWSESKMHAYEIISIPGRNTRTIIKIYSGGEEGITNVFYICLNHIKGLLPGGVTFHKETHSQAKWYFGMWTKQGFEKCCREKEKPGENESQLLFREFM